MKTKKTFLAFGVLVLLSLAGCKSDNNELGSKDSAKVAAADDGIPYTVTLTEFVNPNLPNLHSYSYASYGDKIVLFGGRRKGLHSVNYVFSQGAANKIIYVIDTHSWSPAVSTWSVYSKADSLVIPVSLVKCGNGTPNAGQFRANNAEFFSNGNTMYVIGGLMGATTTSSSTPQTSNPYTIPYMTAINMPNLINAVTAGSLIAANSVYQTYDMRLALTGGEISATGNTVTTAFGWNVYGTIGGLYAHQISTFTYSDTGSSLSISNYSFCPTCNDASQTGTTNVVDSAGNGGSFRRRDGSMSPVIDPSTGNAGLLYYAGVFKNGNTNFTTPIWINTTNATEDANFNMRGNVYTCKVIPVFSSSRNEFYGTMLGGMTNSTYSFNTSNGVSTTPSVTTLMTDQNSTITPADVNNFLSVPFSNGIGTVKVNSAKQLSHYMMAATFPTLSANYPIPTFTSTNFPNQYIVEAVNNASPYNGAEAEFFWNQGQVANNYQNSGVIDFDAFANANPNGAVIGYLFGGLMSVIDNVNMNNIANNQERLTVASNRIFAVTLTPSITTTSHK